MIVVDLDCNDVTISKENELPEVPTEVLKNLKRSLKRELFPQLQGLGRVLFSENAQTLQKLQEEKKKNHARVRLCFLAYFVSLCRDMQKFVNVELEDTADVFDVQYYLDTQVVSHQVCTEV